MTHLTDERIDALNQQAQDAAISTGVPPHRALARAILEASQAAPQQGWQPIETAPKDTRVLLWGTFWNDRDVFQYPLIGLWSPQDEHWLIPCEYRFKVRPTHWQPLPPPPTKEPRDA
jgi:hypothetical protein